MLQTQYPPRHEPLPTCGVYIAEDGIKFLPLVSLDAHTFILSSTSRTILTQVFVNPETGPPRLKNVRYVFPLYDGVSVVGFKCTVGSRVIEGVVKERQEAKRVYVDAIATGQVAGLLEQSSEASDVFTTSLGNIPSGGSVKVEITYLGELKHDAQVDGLRFTIPTSLAHRYGQHSIAGSGTFQGTKHISIIVDADVSGGSAIKSIQSPSHPISVNIGTLSTAASAPPSLNRAHATLFQSSAELGRDFVIQIVASGLGDPMAVLETHPTIPNQRALMTTLVPRFHLPMEMTEVVFMCDRSGSMGDGRKIPNIVGALKILLKSLPVGVKFNVCSFGTQFSFLWDRSKTYDAETLDQAIGHVGAFAANLGGTEMHEPMAEIFQRRYQDMNLEVFLLTDGEIWDQERLFQLINARVSESKGAIRVFTLGVGKDASHSLIEGVARAGNGFAQTVGEDEKMDKMLVRMLKGALTPHITDYALEVRYDSGDAAAEEPGVDDFEVIEKVMDAITLEASSAEPTEAKRAMEETAAQRPISLFDHSVRDKDLEMSGASGSLKVSPPPVAVPRYLQAPFQIPPLFPFSRTTVYVLLSDSTPHRQPKSVILRGTSCHGPLSLEIPVVALAERGTTIHQLAARKAIRELEDGRGWIFHVKDQEGKLLQAQFDGQFDDMVKREAVRLGTQYQVSGKWCSFVAVQHADGDARNRQGDADNSGNEKGDDQGEDAGVFDETSFDNHDIAASRLQRSARAGRAMHARMATRQPNAVHTSIKCRKLHSVDVPLNLQAQQQVQQAEQLRRMRATQAARAAQAAPLQAMQMQPTQAQQQLLQVQQAALLSQMRASQGGQLQAGRLQAMQMQPTPMQTMPPMMQSTQGPQGQPAPRPLIHQMASPQIPIQSSISFGNGSRQMEMKQSPPSVFGNGFGGGDTDVLSSLSALQSFAGKWQWNPRLEAVLGITAQQATERARLSSQYSEHMDVLATLCAVVFLKEKLIEEKESWELFVQKAEDWLRAQTGADVQELEKIVGDALFTNTNKAG
ncbi:vault poly [Trichoderma cornu-damae]|uniref:Vault poly n=1 Tax=Trichoderma cornu-damae TaxID=654480 RepID=A0A9P8QIM2_9HYPO|nr:vault poly [Trichoderma cornu-damae]